MLAPNSFQTVKAAGRQECLSSLNRVQNDLRDHIVLSIHHLYLKAEQRLTLGVSYKEACTAQKSFLPF